MTTKQQWKPWSYDMERYGGPEGTLGWLKIIIVWSPVIVAVYSGKLLYKAILQLANTSAKLAKGLMAAAENQIAISKGREKRGMK